VWLAIAMVGLIFILRWDTPKFSLSLGREEEAIRAIQHIYETDEDLTQANRILRFIEKSGNKETTKVPVLASLWTDERYARATLVNIANMSFHVLTGYSAVMSYSNTIFNTVYED